MNSDQNLYFVGEKLGTQRPNASFCKINAFYNLKGKKSPELCKNCGVATRSVTNLCAKKACGGNKMAQRLKNKTKKDKTNIK